MRRKLPVLILALIILLQVFIPATFAVSKNEAISLTPSFCSLDTTPEGAGSKLFKSQNLLESHYVKHGAEMLGPASPH